MSRLGPNQRESHCAHGLSARIEPLESRRLLAAAIEGGVLVARGSNGGDAIQLERTGIDDVIITIWSGSSTPASKQQFDMDDFSGICLEGLGGNDRIYYSGNGQVNNVTMLGGEGNDWLYGSYVSNAAEHLEGGAGNDTLTGNGGPDSLFGNDGHDTIHRDASDIIASGGLGLDVVLMPGASTSFAVRSGSTLTVTGTSGNDVIRSSGDSAGGNHIAVELNRSIIEFDAAGLDTIRLFGMDGNDEIFLNEILISFEEQQFFTRADGGNGNDRFVVNENAGIHELYGGAGDDVATSDSDSDQLLPNFVSGGAGIDTLIADWTTIDLRNLPDIENARLERGIIYGNQLGNRLELSGDEGRIFAGGGDDTLVGSNGGRSELYGESGNDLFILRDGPNLIDGGSGSDTLQGNGSLNDEVTSIEFFPPPTALLSGSTPNRSLTVLGTVGNDVIELRRVGFDDVRIRVWVNGASTAALDKTFDMDDFTRLYVGGLSGNDAIYVADGAGIPNLVLDGGFGNDTINGSSLNDTIYGGGGSDQLNGIAGDDVFYAGDERWNFEPNPTPDTINGGSGNDTAFIDVGLDTTVNVETVAQAQYDN